MLLLVQCCIGHLGWANIKEKKIQIPGEEKSMIKRWKYLNPLEKAIVAILSIPIFASVASIAIIISPVWLPVSFILGACCMGEHKTKNVDDATDEARGEWYYPWQYGSVIMTRTLIYPVFLLYECIKIICYAFFGWGINKKEEDTKKTLEVITGHKADADVAGSMYGIWRSFCHVNVTPVSENEKPGGYKNNATIRKK
jgi:hypothetical protein